MFHARAVLFSSPVEEDLERGLQSRREDADEESLSVRSGRIHEAILLGRCARRSHVKKRVRHWNARAIGIRPPCARGRTAWWDRRARDSDDDRGKRRGEGDAAKDDANDSLATYWRRDFSSN